MKKIVIALALLIVVLIVGCPFFNPSRPSFNNNYDKYGNSFYYSNSNRINREPELL